MGAKNGVKAQVYSFKEMTYHGDNNKSLYIGQSHHLAYGGSWKKPYMPSGLLHMKDAFRQDGMCFFTGNHGGKQKTRCVAGWTHKWSTATQNRHFLCAKVTGTWESEATVHRTWNNIKLGSKNGVKA